MIAKAAVFVGSGEVVIANRKKNRIKMVKFANRLYKRLRMHLKMGNSVRKDDFRGQLNCI